jgi:competence protein ComEC
VVGDVSRLSPEVREDFRDVGPDAPDGRVAAATSRIVTGAVLLLARALGLRLLLRGVVAALGAGGFVVLARPDPSVLRASVMGLIGLLALVSGSRRSAMPALAAAVILLVLVSPPLAAAPGFALSVLATAGLLVLAPRWRERLRKRMPGWLADALAVPAAAQVACGPVVVAISAQLGLLSVPANLLAVPAVAPATVTGVVAALLAPVWLPAAQAVAWLGWLPTAWLVLVARVGAGIPGAAVPWPDGARGALLLAVLTGLGFLAFRYRRLRLAVVAVATGVLVATAGLSVARPGWPPPGWFLVACDVGQGDAVVLNAGGGSAVRRRRRPRSRRCRPLPGRPAGGARAAGGAEPTCTPTTSTGWRAWRGGVPWAPCRSARCRSRRSRRGRAALGGRGGRPAAGADAGGAAAPG